MTAGSFILAPLTHTHSYTQAQFNVPADCTIHLIPLVLPANACPTCHLQPDTSSNNSSSVTVSTWSRQLPSEHLNRKTNRILC